MQANIIDLRYHMKDILAAIDKNEEVIVLYHGKPKAKLLPWTKVKRKTRLKMKEHPFFGMCRGDTRPVEEVVRDLRKRRYHAI